MDDHSARTILIADDDESIRDVVNETISSLGYHTIQVENGAKAASVAEDLAIDMAILDVTMPELTGIQVCERIRALKHGALIPVLILTARDSIDDKVKALNHGADDYLTKPFNYRELQARVKALMRIRELNVELQLKNQELLSMQEKIVHQERQLLAGQLGGTAAHKLGQPLLALVLNLHLLENLSKDDVRYEKALAAMKSDTKRMTELLEKLRTVNSEDQEAYFGDTSILKLDE